MTNRPVAYICVGTYLEMDSTQYTILLRGVAVAFSIWSNLNSILLEDLRSNEFCEYMAVSINEGLLRV